MPYFKYKNKNVFFRVKGRGRPLLILHGNTVSSGIFKNEINRFYSKYFKIITFDLPGHGKSKKINSFPVDFWRENARVAAGICNLLGAENINIIGVSGGAMIALNIAIEYPDLAKKIIADSFWGEKLEKEQVNNFIAERKKEIGKLWGIALFLLHGFKYKSVIKSDNDMMINFLNSGHTFYSDNPAKIKCPVLFASGEKDAFIPDIKNLTKKIVETNSNFSSTVFEGAGHIVMVSSQKYNFRRTALKFFNAP